MIKSPQDPIISPKPPSWGPSSQPMHLCGMPQVQICPPVLLLPCSDLPPAPTTGAGVAPRQQCHIPNRSGTNMQGFNFLPERRQRQAGSGGREGARGCFPLSRDLCTWLLHLHVQTQLLGLQSLHLTSWKQDKGAFLQVHTERVCPYPHGQNAVL